MGKKAKEHRKKVAARNANIKGAQKKFQSMWQQEMMKQMEVYREEKNRQGSVDNNNDVSTSQDFQIKL
jgi:Rod binding domain-containing protein